ncbi:importin-9-like [Liolophura sinensis]|uniref:importin-9-like n=1 Tax=Liolophura sinensis TaxID=3198878 RepID=UPI0031594CA0
MAGPVDVNRSLKEALYESLSAILSPEQSIRAGGEEQIKALEVTEEFGIHLAEFTVDPQGPLAIRQLASVLLKQYVEVHWSQHAEKFRPPETSNGAKAAVRQILPAGLREPISKVRSSVAYAVSAIAHWDWPEAWPELFNILVQALTSGDTNAVHGAMRVLTEFCQDVTDIQMIQVAPVILPEMYKIFTQAELYSIRTRSRAVSIFNVCSGLIAAMSDLNKGVPKQLLYPVLPQFMEAFVQALQVPDGMTSDSGLKMEVLKAVTTVTKSFPKKMAEWLPQLLTPVWSIFTQSVDVYVRTVINGTEEADDPVDSDGEVLGFENLVYGVFEFVHGLIDSTRFRSTVRKSVDQILYFILQYMQITEDQVKLWSTNPDQFVEDEDDDTFSYSVRISAQDLLLSLTSEFKSGSARALCAAVSQHMQEAEAAKSAGSQNWWKLHESCMLAIGSVKSEIVHCLQDGKIQFDINGFLQSVVLADLSNSVSPFLTGRSLWTASRFTDVMSEELLQSFLQATVGGLHPTQPAVIRICAVRAVSGFSEHLKQSHKTQMLIPHLPNILDGLVAIAQQFSADVLALAMETLAVVLTVDSQFTASSEGKVAPLTIAIFLKYCNDPLVVSLTEDIIKVLSENEGCRQLLQQRLVPTLISIIQAPSDRIPVGLPPIALDLLQTLIRTGCSPISNLLINGFPAVAQCTLSSDDNATLQNGGECLRAYCSVGLEQIINWQDSQGHNGLYYIVQVIIKLLDPKTSEYTATFVGRLVSLVIGKVGEKLGENLDLMLRAVLSKMQQAESLSVMQSLVMVFAHLIHTQLDPVLEFLSNVPGPTGKPALEFVLTEWCSRQHIFYGAYEGKVSAVALTKLLQHAISKNDMRLQNITVQGDQVNQSNGIRTRSKAAQAPEEWTTIPVLVKIYKLLINELSNQMESNMSTQVLTGDEEDEEWDGDEEDDEDDDGDDDGMFKGTQTLSSLLEDFAGDYRGIGLAEDESDEDDPDALNDPIFQIDLQAYLTEFLQSLSQLPCYSMFSAHHTETERQVLQTIGVHS